MFYNFTLKCCFSILFDEHLMFFFSKNVCFLVFGGYFMFFSKNVEFLIFQKVFYFRGFLFSAPPPREVGDGFCPGKYKIKNLRPKVPENYVEHPRVTSERDTDRV